MSMGKKDFIALADHIKTASVGFSQEHLDVLADFCQKQNSLFMRQRWFDYIKGVAGPSGGKIGS